MKYSVSFEVLASINVCKKKVHLSPMYLKKRTRYNCLKVKVWFSAKNYEKNHVAMYKLRHQV